MLKIHHKLKECSNLYCNRLTKYKYCRNCNETLISRKLRFILDYRNDQLSNKKYEDLRK